MRPLILPLVVLAACRGDGRSPERQAPPTSPEPSTSAAPESKPAAAEPVPAGDAQLVPVPPAIAQTVKLEKLASGLARPVLAAIAPGDARKRLFIVEQHTGRVKILEGGAVKPTPFATIGPLSKANEQGLLGMAFSPNFASDGRVYFNYTDADDATRIVEYRVAAANPDAIDPSTRREIVKIAQPYSNHNGGHLAFGPDGKLYTGMGDGGSAGDPEKNGQNREALLAKILRFDVSKPDSPAERVHMGVRNPWRFAFDAKTGDLYIGDVGQNLWEYVFVVPAGSEGKNFGWNIVEGNHCFRSKTCDKAGFTPPVVEYSHDEGCSITGGVVYRGAALPALDGRYFYADFCTNLVRSFRWSAAAPTSVTEHWDWQKAIDPDGSLLSQISSFGVDHEGELLIIELTGNIYRLRKQ